MMKRITSKVRLYLKKVFVFSPITASFTFLYTNHDANTAFISARIIRNAPQNETLYKITHPFFVP
ncbi:hypothetical protein G6554_19705 [Bacillus sp. MM2020_4]|nr:hypothetical protein [Bacillus sp. MM2020_4]